MQLAYRGNNYLIAPSNFTSLEKISEFTYRGTHYSRIVSTFQAIRSAGRYKLTYRGATYYRSF